MRRKKRISKKGRVSPECRGEGCNFHYPNGTRCGKQATRKVGEEILSSDPNPYRHNLTSYLCDEHFAAVMGCQPAEKT